MSCVPGAHRPSVLITSYGLVAGGGETFPIFLANELRARGWPVAFLDCAVVEPEPEIRGLLERNVPLYRLHQDGGIGPLCLRLGVEVVHSCHTSTDLMVAKRLTDLPEAVRPKHVVTLHGGYETLGLESLLLYLPPLLAVDHFVYTASKNLSSFPKQFLERSRFTRIANALPEARPLGRPRADLEVGGDAAIAMLISRAIPGKGWEIAVKAVEHARALSGRDIHLVLIGNGPIYDKMLQPPVPEWLHLLGVQGDIRSWISIADVGLLPTTFSGESYPLVLIDFLTMGVPVIATNVGEIPQMMAGELGVPGYIVEVDDESGLVDRFTAHLVELTGLGAERHDGLRDRALAAAEQFDFQKMVDAYEHVYELVCS